MASQAHRTPTPRVFQTELSPEVMDQQKRFENWLLADRGLGITTIYNRLGEFRRVTAKIGLRPTLEQIHGYIADLRREGKSYAMVHNLIMSIEDYMNFLGTPVHLGRMRRPKQLNKEGLSEGEITLVVYHAKDSREKAILATLAYSGIRNKEFCNLRIKDVDLGSYLISVHWGKGEHDYKAQITGDCAKLLGGYIQERIQDGATENDKVFVTRRHGYPLQQQDLRKIIRVAVRRAGITKRVSPHLFRHSLAMAMLNRGASVMTIQKQLGHSWIQTTMDYLRGEYTRGQHEYPLTAPNYGV